MRNLNELLKGKSIDYNKLSEFGFKFNEDSGIYVYAKVLNNGFEVQIQISPKSKEAFSKIVDIENNMEYALVDIEDAVGEFVGETRAQYDEVLSAFMAACTHKDVFKTKQAAQLIAYIRAKYGDELEFLWEKFDDNAIWRNKINNKWYATLFSVPAEKLGLNENKVYEVSNVMCGKDGASKFINNETIFPAYHMNKKSWITIKLDDKINIEMVYELIDNSYNLSIKKSKKKS